jgi:glycosyltransferase involved in cell wall biosynthesis
MKIAINLTRESVGGITSSNLNLINYLYRNDYEFAGIELNSRTYLKGAAVFRHLDPDLFDHNIININQLPLLEILSRSKNLNDVKNAFAETIKIARKIIKQSKPDVILLSGTYYIPWILSMAAKKEKIPVVLWYSGVLVKETEDMSEKNRAIMLEMEKSINKNASKIIFPSLLCKKTVEKEVVKTSIDNSYIIPNPVSNIFVDPVALDTSIERRISAVGRYVKIKNFDMFFKIHKELKKRKWRHTASFVTSLGADLKKMPKTIETLPPMTAEGLKKFYLSQGLVICPSIFETFGNVPMEAVCLGIPVLVSDKMGCAEILKKVGLENMVISFDDIKKVTDRVQQLCGQSILPRQINALKSILDSNFICEEVRAVIEGVAQKD